MVRFGVRIGIDRKYIIFFVYRVESFEFQLQKGFQK